MDLLLPLVDGVKLLSLPTIAIMAVLGAIWGMIAGAIPGIGSPVAVAVALPLSFLFGSIEAVAFIVAISFGVGFGNSVPAVLVGVPGNPPAFLTALDGYAMHRRGESGLALGTAYFSTVSSQWIAIVAFTVMVIPLSQLPYYFLPPELFALYFVGLAAVASLTGNNIMKGILAAFIGIAIGFVGLDPVTGAERFNLGVYDLRLGVGTVAALIGILAVSELLRSCRQVFTWKDLNEHFDARFPRWSQLRRLVPNTVRGSIIGTLVGAIPGVGSGPSSAIAWQQAKLTSKQPEQFGKGSVQAIAANEAAGSSANAGELVPTLGLGVPGSPATAMLLGALLAHGLIPGPRLLEQSPELLHAAIAGAVGGTITMAALGWGMARLLLRIALTDRSAVLIVALIMTMLGVFAIRQQMIDLYVMLATGLIGYFMLRYGYATVAAAMGIILGPGLEAHLRRGLTMTDNSFVAFFSRPITAGIMAIGIAVLLYGSYSTWKIARKEKASESQGSAEEGEPTEGQPHVLERPTEGQLSGGQPAGHAERDTASPASDAEPAGARSTPDGEPRLNNYHGRRRSKQRIRGGRNNGDPPSYPPP